MISEERYLLGFPEIDLQHDYLYNLFGRIGTTIWSTERIQARLLIDEIERYIAFHFTCEEHLMRAYNFSGFAAHQSDHEIAASKLVQFMDDFDNNRLNSAAMRIFLTGWLMEHSRTADVLYVQWIKKCRQDVFS